jgi:hypothetical protein
MLPNWLFTVIFQSALRLGENGRDGTSISRFPPIHPGLVFNGSCFTVNHKNGACLGVYASYCYQVNYILS